MSEGVFGRRTAESLKNETLRYLLLSRKKSGT
jgi:hypothetical protein